MKMYFALTLSLVRLPSPNLGEGLGVRVIFKGELTMTGHIEIVEGDITRQKVDAIVNAAGLSNGSRDLAGLRDANVAPVRVVLALVRQLPQPAHVVHLSSPSVHFAPRDRFSVADDEPFTRPVTTYAQTKQEAERLLVAATDVDWTVLRLRAVYGAGIPSLVETLRHQIAGGIVPLVRRGAVRTDMLHVEDFADATAAVIAAGREVARHRIYNVAGPEALSFAEMVAILAKKAEAEPRYLPVPAGAILLAGAAAQSLGLIMPATWDPPIHRHKAGALVWSQTLDLSRIIGETGWRPARTFADFA